MENQSSNNKRMARNTLFLYIRMAFVMFVSLYTSRVILQTLGVVDFGIYNVVAGFVSMFSFLNTSLTACIQRFYNFEQGRKGDLGFNRVYGTSLIIQSFLAIIIFLLIESVGIWYLEYKLVIPIDRMPAARILFQASAFSLLAVIIQVPYSAAIIAKEKMDYYALVGIVDVLLKLAIVIVLPFADTDSLALYGVLLFSVSVIDFLMYFIYSKYNIPNLIFKLYWDKRMIGEMLSFSCWSTLGSFAQIIRNQGVNMLLNMFFGPAINAARGISYQVMAAMSSLMANVPTAARPQLVESYAKGNLDRSKRIMMTTSKICVFMIYIVGLPAVYKMDYLLHLWLGADIPSYTVIFSQIIVLITIVETLNWPISMIIYASGKIKKYNIFTSLAGISTLPLCYIAVKLDGGPILVYIVTFAVSLFVQVLSIYCMKQITGIGFNEYNNNVVIPFLKVLVLSVVMPYPLLFIFENGFVSCVLFFLISILWSSFMCYMIGMDSQEKMLLKQLLFQIVSKITRSDDK